MKINDLCTEREAQAKNRFRRRLGSDERFRKEAGKVSGKSGGRV